MWQLNLSDWNAGALCRLADYYDGYTPEAVTKLADDFGLEHNHVLAAAILQCAVSVRDEDAERRIITEDMYYGRDA